MDTFLVRTNTHPQHNLSSFFVDDVLGLSKSMVELKSFLNDADIWAGDYDMVWSIPKSCGLDLPARVSFKEERMPQSTKPCYLGVTLWKRSVLDHRLLTRLSGARKLLMQLRTTTKKCNLSVAIRRRFIKTFIFSIMDYVLYLQPYSERVEALSKSLDQMCLTYIMGMPVNPQHSNRGSRILKLLTLRERRRRHMVQLIYRLKLHLILDPANERALINWRTLTAHSTVRSFVKASTPPDIAEDLLRWRKLHLEMNSEMDWGDTNCFRRNIPGTPTLPPIFKADIQGRLEKMALRWYLNRIPGSPTLSAAKEQLHFLLGKSSLD